jgi:hypothetical protein
MEEILKYLPTIAGVVAVIVWLVRMEGKVSYLDSEVKEVKDDVNKVLELKPLIIQIQNDIKWIKKLIETKFSNKK